MNDQATLEQAVPEATDVNRVDNPEHQPVFVQTPEDQGKDDQPVEG